MGFLWESINGRPLAEREKRGLGDKSYIEKMKIGLGTDIALFQIKRGAGALNATGWTGTQSEGCGKWAFRINVNIGDYF